ncbi:TIGR03619 family F420-dependent LLM class oxidoreductase [Streptomyces sp. Lzd4kr]|nr:TIGR03619 family F420-dependent LLM class oxidoreductase [Streptomyces sp. Lzd4kr]
MLLGLALPTYGPDADPNPLIRFGRAAEEMGYDSVWTGDRVLAPVQPSAPYPSADGIMPREFERHLDPLTALTFVAAHTERIRLGTSTLNGLWQPALMLARSLTTLDHLSHGRLDVGLGLGWMPDEYTALGVPWARRGDRLEETLTVLQKYWTQDHLQHEGTLFSIPKSVVGLKPFQRPGPPILLAAFSGAGLRRVGRRADGWLPVAMPLPAVMDSWAIAVQAAEKAGRDPSALRMALRVNTHLTDTKARAEDVPFSGTLQQYIDYALSAAEAGVHELFFDFGLTSLTLDERLELAETIIKGVRTR